jgi:hypothetical protein
VLHRLSALPAPRPSTIAEILLPVDREMNILLQWGLLFFSTKSKKQQTPRQSCGTQVRAFFAVRKQCSPQVTLVEGCAPMGNMR